MARIDYPTQLLVDISNKQYGDTVIKRRAELVDLLYSSTKKRVAIEVKIHVYSKLVDESGEETYGDELDGVPGFNSYDRRILADMSTLVRADTGQIIGERELEDNEANFAAPVLDTDGKILTPGGILYNVNYMYEYVFYKYVAAKQPVIIDNLIIDKIMWADQNGKLD